MRSLPTALTTLTLAEARDGLVHKQFSARELTEAHISAVEAVRPLNAFVTETPERACEMAAASDARLAARRGAAARRHPDRDQGSVLHQRRVDDRRLAHPRRVRAALQIDRHRKAVAGGCVMLGKANLDEFAMGSSNHDELLRPGRKPVAPPPGDNRAAGARRLVGRLGGGGGGACRRWRRPAPTPAARSASRRAFAASSG